ncbi:phenylpyruvate tautomerase MIF-related protein [Priestia megaterium]|uniref:phenylpyruvate tautomerase MIF-related protein n=1 Tax=Priestia megaterium TaxID=1404 RepID=UPI003EE395E4
MPFIISKVNTPITKEQKLLLKSGLGKAIELIPRKSENSLMLGFEDNYRLFLRGGDSQPLAFITVSVFDNLEHKGYEKLSLAITELFNKILGIDLNNIYIKYEDINSWSVAGLTFEQNRGERHN